MNFVDHCDAFILAGGKSSRMGSDKGLLLINDREMILQVMEPLQQLFSSVAVITANAGYRKFGVPLFQDERIHAGPAGGLLTALRNAHSSWVFMAACDLPFISSELIREMAIKRNGHLAVVPVHQLSAEPLCAFYHRELIPVLEKAIDSNQLKMQNIIRQIPTFYFDADEKKFDINRIFMNVNTPEDLNNAAKKYGSL